MDTLNNYISEKLFTDIDTQINIIDDQIIKKEISKLLNIFEYRINIENKCINIDCAVSISFVNKTVKKFIKDIYNQGYKFKSIYKLRTFICDNDQLDYFNEIFTNSFTIIFMAPVRLSDLTINFIDEENTLNISRPERIINSDYKINLKNTHNMYLFMHQIEAYDINVFDNVLKNIYPDKQILTLSFSRIKMNKKDIEYRFAQDINKCKFIKNKKLVPINGILLEFEFNNTNNVIAFDIIGKPGTKSFKLKPID